MPKQRARRLLKHWNHPKILMIRGREHAANVLSGVHPVQHQELQHHYNQSATSRQSHGFVQSNVVKCGEFEKAMIKMIDIVYIDINNCLDN